MRHTRGSENIPISAFNRVLVADHQRGHNACQLAVVHPLKNGLSHGLAGALDGLGPAICQFFWRCVAFASPHITCGLNALLPQPQLVVKAMRVAVAVRRFQAHRHLPAIASPQRLRLAL